MKSLFTFLISIFALVEINAQCNAFLLLRTQSDVDAFSCAGAFTNTLWIWDDDDGVDPITNLDGLLSLTEVTETLQIFNNPDLVNIDGLSNLVSVGESLEFNNNASMINVDGLSSLVTVGEYFRLFQSPALTNVNGLANLISTGAELLIGNAPILTELNLPGLTYVGGDLAIQNNASLTSLVEFSNLTEVGGNLFVNSNDQLSVCCGLIPILTPSGIVNGNINIANNEPGCNSETEILNAGPCPTCPTVGSVSALPATVCENETFDLTAAGLEDMAMSQNAESDFGIEFLYWTSPVIDPYGTGGTSLGTVPFGSLTPGNTEAILNGISLPLGTYHIYAILSPVHTNPSCRPSASTTVLIGDDEAPVAICKDITVQLDASGTATVVPADVNDGSTDNCGITSMNVNGFLSVLLGCANVGQPNQVELNVFDAEGLTDNCISNVTVINSAPTAVCQSATAQLDITGNVTLNPNDFDGGSTDDCGIASISVVPDMFDCSNLGINNIVLTVIDDQGIRSSCSTTVEIVNVDLSAVVTEQSGPTFTDGAIDLTASGGAQPLTYMWSNGATTEDLTGLTTDTYDVTITDLAGCAQTASYFVDQGTIYPTRLCLNVLLQGSFNSATTGPSDRMRTTLNDNGLIPDNHPYNTTPWDYMGTEAFDLLNPKPAEMVDWVLIRVRAGDDPSIIIEKQACVLLADGSIRTFNDFLPVFNLDYLLTHYIEVIHRNHLPISTPVPMQPDLPGGDICHDFTSSMSSAFRDINLNDDPMKQLNSLGGTFFTMHAGNVQSFDLFIDASDFNMLFGTYNSSGIYVNSDVNMDISTNANDINMLFGNFNNNAHTPY